MDLLGNDSMDSKVNIPLQILACICKSVDNLNVQRLKSYKAVESLMEEIGLPNEYIEYITTVNLEGELIDSFICQKREMTFYANNRRVESFRVKNPTYMFKMFLKHNLPNYSTAEASLGIVCSRKY